MRINDIELLKSIEPSGLCEQSFLNAYRTSYLHSFLNEVLRLEHLDRKGNRMSGLDITKASNGRVIGKKGLGLQGSIERLNSF